MTTSAANIRAEMWTRARQQGKSAHLIKNPSDEGFTLHVLPNAAPITVSAGEISGLGNAAAGRTLIKAKLEAAGIKSPY